MNKLSRFKLISSLIKITVFLGALVAVPNAYSKTEWGPGMIPVALAAPFTYGGVNFDPSFPTKWLCENGDGYCAKPYGSGYFTFTQDRVDCPIRTPYSLEYFGNPDHAGQLCPTHFQWNRDTNNDLYADILVETSHLNFTPGSPYVYSPYSGLQLNMPNQAFPYGGVPPQLGISANTLHSVEFEYRAATCVPTERPLNEYSNGRFIVNLSMWNPNQLTRSGTNGFDVTINLNSYTWSIPGFPGSIAQPGLPARWECENMNVKTPPGEGCGLTVMNIHAPDWQLTQTNWLDYKKAPYCSVQQHGIQPGTPFRKAKFDAKEIFQKLVNLGFITPEYLAGATYTGGIVGGIEFWGPALNQLHIKNYKVYTAAPYTLNQPVGRVLRAQDKNNIYYRNSSGQYCIYANDQHAGYPDKNTLPELTEFYNGGFPLCP